MEKDIQITNRLLISLQTQVGTGFLLFMMLLKWVFHWIGYIKSPE